MNFSFYIARRYLFSRKKTNLINLISAISVGGLVIGTMGLIIGLSGFNGFDSLIKSLFSSFDPEIRITIKEGKRFDASGAPFEELRRMPGVAYYAEIVEDNALLRYEDRQVFATIKGVSEDYLQSSGIDTMLTQGEFKLKDASNNFAVLGEGIAYNLGAGINQVDPISVYVPKRGRESSVLPGGNFNQKFIYPSGFFSIQQELDTKYILVPISFAREIFEQPDMVSAVELKLKEGVPEKETMASISALLGNHFDVKNRYQQHDYLYKTMQSEKYATYLILILILVIASFNIVGSLTMLILDKKEDIAILRSMGASKSTIRNIFLFEGWLISFLGAIIGTLAGLAICQAQISYGLVKLSDKASSFIIDAYPMKIVPTDVILIVISVSLIGFLAAWYPVRFISDKLFSDENH
ncbi:MAG TPA: FtsX-like permease family protein [Prolixibacteraceae bacterium]|nr:FtsX-like permease family protein [Prolixibacteraceae bacterium]